MFSLIITIVSIALVVALVAATMYHGGDTLTQGRVTADAAAFVSGAQQIAGAQVMHLSLEGKAASTVSGGDAGTDLVLDKYLASAPVVKAAAGSDWTIDTTAKLVKNTVDSDAVCAQINKSAGVDSTKISAGTVVATDFAAKAYGCVQAAGADKNSFQFKY